MRARRMLTALLATVLSIGGIAPALVIAQEATPAAMPGGIEVVASGLDSPRGFTWSDDGTLIIALAGDGGDTQIQPMEGFTLALGLSSSVATIADGCATPLVAGLLSAHWVEQGWVWGTMDVAFLNGELYALIGAGGPSWLTPSSFSGVYRINDDGTMDLVADITNWLPDHPPAFVPPDYGSDGSLFDLEAAGDALLLSEAVGGQLLRVTPDGEISTVADLSEGHMVPTGIAVDDEGNAFVGFETTPPFEDGSSKVVKVTPDGVVSDAWTGLTSVTDVVLGPDGALYAAEMATGNTGEPPFLTPHSGRIVRQTGPDSLEAVVVDADYPVHFGFDTGGALYLAYPAFGPNGGAGIGALLRIDISSDTPVSLAGLGELEATCMS